MDKITESREATQPIKSRTGGSTFKNPPGHKAWQLIDAAGCRGLKVGDAQVSRMHCNFLINLGGATAADIETLGETVRSASRRIPASSSNGRSSGSGSAKDAVDMSRLPDSRRRRRARRAHGRAGAGRRGWPVRRAEGARIRRHRIRNPARPQCFHVLDRLGVSDAVLQKADCPPARADARCIHRRTRSRACRPERRFASASSVPTSSSTASTCITCCSMPAGAAARSSWCPTPW